MSAAVWQLASIGLKLAYRKLSSSFRNENVVPDTPTVLLLIETSSGFTRRLIRGVSGFCNQNSPWVLQLDEGGPEMLRSNWKQRLQSWAADTRPEGIIAHVESREIWDELCETQLPLVNVSGIEWDKKTPRVDVNNQSVCRMVVEDFAGRGFHSLAYCGVPSLLCSEQRSELFLNECKSRSITCQTYRLSSVSVTSKEVDELAEWILTLPESTAIMACNDACARIVATACQVAGRSVPDQIAITGVDNDELVCELSEPTLSSVIPNTERIGYAAAAVMQDLLQHGEVIHPIPNIDPIGIETRHSTDATAIGQDFIRLAMRFIYGHAHEGINVDDVIKSVPISRTSLEKGFRELLGRTPLAEITRLRMQKARQLLSSTQLSLSEIAGRVGYDRVDYFSTVFRRENDSSPSQYRTDCKDGG
ncbi:MAG: DNA-binding transcriptional regulator [Gimesia sp.]